MTTILIVDDDPAILSVLRRGLRIEGYTVQAADTGPAAVRMARIAPPDLIILDVMLPELDGLDVCRRLRRDLKTPILMLTARDAIRDRIAGLDSGADDYLVKPFDFDELLARIRALLRRVQPEDQTVLRYGDLVLDVKGMEACRGLRRFELTARETVLLHLFLTHPRQVLTRDQLLAHVWGETLIESNAVEVQIGRLRDKLEAAGERRILQTIRGVGYVLREETR
jgi:two-component system, OmpR family, response regulator MprA